MVRVKGQGPSKANIMVVGMAPEKNEVSQGKPFVGSSGEKLNQALHGNGIKREDVFATNISEVPLYEFGKETVSCKQLSQPFLDGELSRLKREIHNVNPNIIVTLGDDPLYFLTGKTGVTKWRGSLLPSSLMLGRKVLATVHPAWIQRGMWRWLTIFQSVDIARAVSESGFSELRYPKLTMHIAPKRQAVLEFIDVCKKNPWTCFDIETAAWAQSRTGHIACFGIGYNQNEAMCIPFIKNRTAPFYNEPDEVMIWKELTALLESDTQKIGQNFSFDWLYCWVYGIYPRNPYIDLMLLHHCLYPDFGGAESFFGNRSRRLDKPGHSLAFINSMYTTHPYYKDDGKFWDGRSSIEELWEYNCRDVAITYQCSVKAMKEAVASNLWSLFQDKYMRAFLKVLRIEWYGVEWDVEKQKAALTATTARIKELDALIKSDVGFELNVNSPKQLAEFLYKKRKYKPVLSKITNRPTADKYALEKLAVEHTDHILRYILESRRARDFRADILGQSLDKGNRIHTHYNIGGTNGARWSSSKSILGNGTNLQNIPRKGVARELFIAS